MIGGSTFANELSGIDKWAASAVPIGSAEYVTRIDKARALVAQHGADALIIGAGDSLRYFAGIGWGMIERLVALVISLTHRPMLVCPAFEAGSLEAILKHDFELRYWEEHESPSDLIASVLRERGCWTIAIDPALPFGIAEKLRASASSTTMTSAASIIDRCRSIKSPTELTLLRHAKSMTLEVQRRAARILEPGIRASTVRRFIDEAHKAIGAAGSSFCIVQFGRSTAFPHGLPTDHVLREGDMVLIDAGCTVEGYHSDITRSYVFGSASAEQASVWEIEQAAQRAAFETVQPGRRCEDIDDAARAILERHGLGPDYALPGLPHRTGHGVGLTIHEAPYLVRGDRTILAPGMCFSNEPMIVVPGKFGIRLEDHLFVTDAGAEWFTTPSAAIDRPFS